MNDNNNSSNTKWYTDRSVQLTILGVAGTIIAAIISILPQFIGNSRNVEPTQTPLVWTVTVVELPTDTPEPIFPTDTAIPGPTDTPTLSPTPTETPTATPITPPLNCLDRWEVISSDLDLLETDAAGDCAQASAPGLGISASSNGISFGINNFREVGTFGITTSLPDNAIVTLDITLTVLTQGEFWIALSNTPNPENNMYILAMQPKSGELRTYSDQTNSFIEKYRYRDVTTNTPYGSGPPFIYSITLDTSGNRVDPKIHFTELPAQIVNLPNYLFIGYSNNSTLGSASLQVEITNLVIEVE